MSSPALTETHVKNLHASIITVWGSIRAECRFSKKNRQLFDTGKSAT